VTTVSCASWRSISSSTCMANEYMCDTSVADVAECQFCLVPSSRACTCMFVGEVHALHVVSFGSHNWPSHLGQLIAARCRQAVAPPSQLQVWQYPPNFSHPNHLTPPPLPPSCPPPLPGQQHKPACSCPVLPPALPASSHHIPAPSLTPPPHSSPSPAPLPSLQWCL
jgi:hypothetical protein